MLKPFRVLIAVASGIYLLGCSLGGCQCQRSVEEDAKIDMPTIVDKDPQADKPMVRFPEHCQTADQSLNSFIHKVLQVCVTGDYDEFRQLFGAAYTPTSKDNFERIWYGVQSVDVLSVRGPDETPAYYIHALVHLRQPDSRNRWKRNAVVMAFREAGGWRIGPPPKEIIQKVILADSQPASEPASASQPAAERHRIAEQRGRGKPDRR